MDITITLKNYRCFQDGHPVSFSLRDGFTSFVGVNNSGKSSILKFFHEFRRLFQLLSSPSGNFSSALMKPQHDSFNLPIKDNNEVFCNLNGRNLELQIEFQEIRQELSKGQLPTPKKLIITFFRSDFSWSAALFGDWQKDIVSLESIGFEGTALKVNGKSVADLAPVFETFRLLSRMLYIGPFRNAINAGMDMNVSPFNIQNGNYFDIHMGQAFIRAWRSFKTGSTITNNEAAIKVTDDIRRVFGFDRLEINAGETDADLKIFINDKSYTLSELGAGLAQFIIILANAALKRPSFILIDEPELNLHPRLQLDLLSTLGVYATQGVIFATHSIGLARASSQQIYSIRVGKNETREIRELEQLDSLAEFLGEIGFSAQRELGFDTLLLVEGPHDVTTIRELLRARGKEHEIVVIPLGGGSLVNEAAEPQLAELLRITPKIFALIDSERSAENEKLNVNIRGFVKACKKLGISCHVLKYRALENYLSDGAVKKVKGSQFSAISPYEKLIPSVHGWGKSENWKIAREMAQSELAGTDLGAFLSTV